MTRWATFDCYGTLIDWDGGIRTCLVGLWPEADVDRLLERYHEIEPRVQQGSSMPYREVLARTPLASSLSDARRSLAQGALYVNGARADAERRLGAADLLHGRWVLLRKGKRTHHLLDALGSG